jgi:hypothetical protein
MQELPSGHAETPICNGSAGAIAGIHLQINVLHATNRRTMRRSGVRTFGKPNKEDQP